MNFYKHFLGDYARDTKGLSVIEHGAYRLLLDHVYATEDRLPDDKPELYRIVGAMTPAERKAVDKVADRFFPVNGDGRRHNKRAEIEIAEAKAKSAKAKGSAEARWGKADGEPSEQRTDLLSDMRTHSAGNASQSQRPEEANTSVASQRKAATASRPIPDCPHEQLLALYHELLPTCTRVEKWTPSRQALARARWREEAQLHRDRPKHAGYTSVEGGLEYWRRFFAWCSESKFLTGREPGRNGGPPFVASLPWLLKSENFAKAIEGNYNR